MNGTYDLFWREGEEKRDFDLDVVSTLHGRLGQTTVGDSTERLSGLVTNLGRRIDVVWTSVPYFTGRTRQARKARLGRRINVVWTSAGCAPSRT